MKTIVALAILIVGTLGVPHFPSKGVSLKDLSVNKPVSIESRIIGGQEGILGQFPWQVALFITVSGGQILCGATIIADQWVLTAAHCLSGAYSVDLHFGTTTLNLNGEDEDRLILNSIEWYIHPDFNPNTLNNAVALIKLPQAVEESEIIQFIRLPNAGEVLGAGVNATIIGWGSTSDFPLVSNNLFFATLTSITNLQCAFTFGNQIVIGTTVCAIGNPLESLCQGDAGGPLVTYDDSGVATQVGIAAFISAIGCTLELPSGFVRTEPFLDWINETITENA